MMRRYLIPLLFLTLWPASTGYMSAVPVDMPERTEYEYESAAHSGTLMPTTCSMSFLHKPAGSSEWLEAPVLAHGCEATLVTVTRTIAWVDVLVPLPTGGHVTVMLPAPREERTEQPVQVSSRVRSDSFLLREARNLSEKAARDINHLIQQFLNGNRNPGLGNRSLDGTGLFYLRGRNGGRVFLRWTGAKALEVVAYADKANEEAIIQHLLKMYGK